MKKESSKNRLDKKTLYLPILNKLKVTTNLTEIRTGLNISKQRLNYYLRQLRDSGLVINKSRGLWELTNNSKNPAKYGKNLSKDTIRGHAYVINIIPQKLPAEWKNRLQIIKKKGINYKLVGAKETTPRIKVYGRKVWLCNDHIRIFDKPGESYYGLNAIESRAQAFMTFYKVLGALENKLGISLRPYEFEWRKEHYAFIKNDLAIDQNEKGIIWRIKDEQGREWLLIDDSLEMGGELENVGKKALVRNVKMQRWWNDNKDTDFKVTPTFIQNSFKQTNDMIMKNAKHLNFYAENMRTHVAAIQTLSETVKELKEEVKKLRT